jgi:predicted DNA-binding transcriptional regulator YafY
VGFNPEIFERDRNIAAAGVMIDEAASNGAKIIVLPQMSMSGANYPSPEAFLPVVGTHMLRGRGGGLAGSQAAQGALFTEPKKPDKA